MHERDHDIGQRRGQRIDRFLQKMLPALPPSLMYRYLRTRRIKLNGGRCAERTS
jgi:23S rRNA pseudouridine955/2504/2580 synthase